MEKKRRRVQNSDQSNAILVSSSTEKVKTISDQQQKDKESNYLKKPHMLFR